MVLAIIALGYGLAGPLIGKGQGSSEHKAAVRQVVQSLKAARNQAISERKETTVGFDLKERVMTRADERFVLPTEVEIKLDTTAKELSGEGKGAIRFYPDGGSTGGRVSLSRKERLLRIDVDWLSGRVSVHEEQI
ncbi:MAG: hypothetical protein RLZZ502_808 [Pseudomonadota bacterium]